MHEIITSYPGSLFSIDDSVRSQWISAIRHRAVAACLSPFLRGFDAKLCRPGALPAHGIHRILVCLPNHRLGNAVLISALLCEVEKLYPGAQIDIVSAGSAAQSLFSTRFHVHRVISFPRRVVFHPAAAAKAFKQLRHRGYDLAIDACPGSNSTRWFLATVRARHRVGLPEPRHTDVGSLHRDTGLPPHMAKSSVFRLRAACARRANTVYPSLNVVLTADEIEHGRQTLAAILHEDSAGAGDGPVIGIFPNATGAKRYAQAWWSGFLPVLRTLRPGVRIVNVLAEHGHSQLGDITASFYSSDLRKMAAVISNLHGFISADCGVMHLATAVGTPTFGLFALDNSDRYAPYGPANDFIRTAGMDVALIAYAATDWVDRAIHAHAEPTV